ncbi:MAG TPA: hypothetical protein VIF13_00585 [Hyphomicrobium sp.]
MIEYLPNHAAKARAVRACLASLAAFVFLVPMAHADECLNTTTSTAEPDFTPCDSGLPEIDLDAALAAHAATAQPAKPADGTPWIAQSDKNVPLTVNSSDAGMSLRTSLDDLRDFNTRNFTTETGAPALPKTTGSKSPLDVWTSVNLDGYDGNPDQSTRAGLGVDYKLSHKALVGVSVERGDARSITTGTEQDSKASAYVTLQATPLLSLDARTEWQAGNAEFAAANGGAEKSAIILAPKINHSFALGDGKTIAPFVTYKREFDMSTGPEALNTPQRSAGAGVTYTDPDAYTFSVTTDVDAATAITPESMSSKFQLSVPIN